MISSNAECATVNNTTFACVKVPNLIKGVDAIQLGWQMIEVS